MRGGANEPAAGKPPSRAHSYGNPADCRHNVDTLTVCNYRLDDGRYNGTWRSKDSDNNRMGPCLHTQSIRTPITRGQRPKGSESYALTMRSRAGIVKDQRGERSA
jgi:hypothetical protein